MNITIIGASAGVGLLSVQQALAKGHTVVALSRTTASLPAQPGLTVMQGSATNATDVKKATANADAVIVAIGTGKSTKATTLYTDAAKALVQAQQETGTTIPFIILTGFGAGNSSRYQGFFMKLIFRLLLKAVYENKTRMEEMIAASTISWAFVRPGMLNDKPLSGKYRVETHYRKGMHIGSISRADVADFLIQQAVHPTTLGMYPALSNK